MLLPFRGFLELSICTVSYMVPLCASIDPFVGFSAGASEDIAPQSLGSLGLVQEQGQERWEFAGVEICLLPLRGSA